MLVPGNVFSEAHLRTPDAAGVKGAGGDVRNVSAATIAKSALQ